jgi:hypothetical protein
MLALAAEDVEENGVGEDEEDGDDQPGTLLCYATVSGTRIMLLCYRRDRGPPCTTGCQTKDPVSAHIARTERERIVCFSSKNDWNDKAFEQEAEVSGEDDDEDEDEEGVDEYQPDGFVVADDEEDELFDAGQRKRGTKRDKPSKHHRRLKKLKLTMHGDEDDRILMADNRLVMDGPIRTTGHTEILPTGHRVIANMPDEDYEESENSSNFIVPDDDDEEEEPGERKSRRPRSRRWASANMVKAGSDI